MLRKCLSEPKRVGIIAYGSNNAWFSSHFRSFEPIKCTCRSRKTVNAMKIKVASANRMSRQDSRYSGRRNNPQVNSLILPYAKSNNQRQTYKQRTY